MEKILNASRRFLRDEEGVTAIEYALLAALIALALLVGAAALGDGLSNFFQAIADFLADKAPVVGEGG